MFTVSECTDRWQWVSQVEIPTISQQPLSCHTRALARRERRSLGQSFTKQKVIESVNGHFTPPEPEPQHSDAFQRLSDGYWYGYISYRSCEQCAGSMARWFKEHLGFKTTKAPPPAPPKPDYRHFHTTVSSPPAFHLQQQSGTGLMSAQPDILTAYKLQKELDFEDPYTPGGNMPFSTGLSSAGSPDVKYVSPKHRLIKVETVERSSSSSGSSSGVAAVKSPSSPPAEPENGKQEKVRPMRAHAHLHRYIFSAERDTYISSITQYTYIWVTCYLYKNLKIYFNFYQLFIYFEYILQAFFLFTVFCLEKKTTLFYIEMAYTVY